MNRPSPDSGDGQPPPGAPQDSSSAKAAKTSSLGPDTSKRQACDAYEAGKSDASKPGKAGAPARQSPPVQPSPTDPQVTPAPAGRQSDVAPDQAQTLPDASPEADKTADAAKPAPAFGSSETATQVETAAADTQPAAAPNTFRIAPDDASAATATADEAQATTVAPEPPKPVWKDLPPDDPNDPVPHMQGACQSLDNLWDLAAGSVRGKLHAHKAMHRDDAFAFGCVDGWHILAVSDGAGSAKLSRVGARVTCDAAVGAMKTMLSGYTFSSKEGTRPPKRDLMQLQAMLTLAACEARDAIVSEAHQRKISHRELYCTLLLCIHANWKEDTDLLGAIQVGDGSIGIYTGDGKCTLVGIADHGEYSSETVFVTLFEQLIKRPYDRRVLFSVKTDVRCIGVMSDGVSDDFFPENKRLVELFVGDPIGEIKDASGEPVKGVMSCVLRDGDPKAALLKWLKYEKRGSSDDRTLLLMYRKDKL